MTASDLIFGATVLIVVYSFGVVVGFLACIEFVQDYYERKTRDQPREDYPQVVEGKATGRGRVSRPRLGNPTEWRTGHRRLDTGWSGRLSPSESGGEDAGGNGIQDPEGEAETVRELRLYYGGRDQPIGIYRTRGRWAEAEESGQ